MVNQPLVDATNDEDIVVAPEQQDSQQTYDVLAQATEAARARKSGNPFTTNNVTGGQQALLALNKKPLRVAGRGNNVTSSNDYFPSPNIKESSFQDPTTGTWNQYTPTAPFPFAALDKNQAVLNEARDSYLKAAGELNDAVPQGFSPYQPKINDLYFNTLKNYEAQALDQYGNRGYEVLRSGEGELGRKFHQDLSNIQAMANQTETAAKYIGSLQNDMSDPTKFVPNDARTAIKDYLNGAYDISNTGTTDKNLNALYNKIQTYPALVAQLEKYKPFIQKDTVYSGTLDKMKGGSVNGSEVRKQDITEAVSDETAKYIAASMYHDNPALAQQIHPDDLVKMIQDYGGHVLKNELVHFSAPPKGSGEKDENMTDWVVNYTHQLATGTVPGSKVMQNYAYNPASGKNDIPLPNKGSYAPVPYDWKEKDKDDNDKYVAGIYTASDGTRYKVYRDQLDKNGNFATTDVTKNENKVNNLWLDVAVPYSRAVYGTGIDKELNKSSAKLWKSNPQAAQLLNVPNNIFGNTGGQQQQETKTVGNVTYVKINGQWFQQ